MEKRVKYPRTPHLPWSEGISDDDTLLYTIDGFKNKEVVVTEKMDGENTTLYTDGLHARSIDSKNHPSRNWVKQFWSVRAADIPSNIRICGENLYAKHSIYYPDLESYFLGFSVWHNETCLSWDLTKEHFKLLDIRSVPEITRGTFNSDLMTKIQQIWNQMDPRMHEGYVIRLADSFSLDQVKSGAAIAKYIRKNHVTTDNHWMNQTIIKNGLKPKGPK